MAEPKKDGSERRRSKRIDARIEVQFRSGKEFVACYTQNLSKGGIYLETETLPDPNASIEIVLELPPSASRKKGDTIKVVGRVVRLMTISMDSKTIHKIGVQFLDVNPQTQMQLDLFYEELANAS
ncbi:MAG: PilZ domain-containing protein [Deltaproteobacteria bacterium]|nr:PilZ domain-containing protein [Deltaproteobacteria bacterium]